MIERSGYVAQLLSEEKFVLFWPQICAELEKVPHIWEPWWTKDSLYTMVMADCLQCWGVGTEDEIQAIAFTQIARYPTGNVFHCFLAFGVGMLEMVDALEAGFERYALAHGCHLAEVTGRPGWEEVLKRKGFKKSSVKLLRHLEPARTH